jgi:phosphoenolpyruvate synthase/pyruvate phosphate dikinase
MPTPESSQTPFIRPLDAPALTLADAGGKGANLGALVRAGLPVPPGFVVLTGAYRAFVAANGAGAANRGAVGRTRPGQRRRV